MKHIKVILILHRGRGHTNQDIQIIVVIIKVQQRPFWKSYHDSFEVTHAQYELRGYCAFCFGAELTQFPRTAKSHGQYQEL